TYRLGRRNRRLKVDHEIYSYREGIRNRRCALRMDDVLRTGLNHQPWSHHGSVSPVYCGLEFPLHLERTHRRDSSIGLSKAVPVWPVSYPDRREIFAPATPDAVCYEPGVPKIARGIQSPLRHTDERPEQAEVPVLPRIAPSQNRLIAQNIQTV